MFSNLKKEKLTKGIAYLCGEYPRATDTFIQREIQALRQNGLRIETIAVRRPKHGERGSAEQEEERKRTHYLLPCAPWSLLLTHGRQLLSNPLLYLRTIWMALTVRAPGFRALLYQFFYFAEAGLVARHMQKRGLQHIHNHSPDSSGYVAMLAAKLGGFTYSMTIHGFGILSEPSRWRLRAKIEGALFTICVSHYARSQAMLWSKRSCWSTIHVVRCGVDPGMMTPRLHEGIGRRLLYVGRFDHVKGLPLLLEAFAALAKKSPELHLDMVGDGPERKDLERMVEELGLSYRITFHGYHSQAELRGDYARADIFVMTSFVEGIPVVLMEAMARGLPVVAPRITGIPELVEDGVSGYLYTPGVVEELVAKLETLKDEPETRNRFAKAGQDVVENVYNLFIENLKLSDIFKMVVDTKSILCIERD